MAGTVHIIYQLGTYQALLRELHAEARIICSQWTNVLRTTVGKARDRNEARIPYHPLEH